MKINFSKKFFFVFILFSFSYLASLTNQEIETSAKARYSSDTPGFLSVLYSGNSGKWFELETALYVEKSGEKVIGFDLDLTFINREGQPIFIPFEGGKYELRTTEYDVITHHHVFECKCSDRYAKMKKFLKEEIVLQWLRAVCEEWENGLLRVRFGFNRKGRSIMTINGQSTFCKDISIMSKWVADCGIEQCRKLWFELIKMLAEMEQRLRECNISCRDKINFESFLSLHYFKKDFLEPEFAGMQIAA